MTVGRDGVASERTGTDEVVAFVGGDPLKRAGGWPAAARQCGYRRVAGQPLER
jgi:hypothetical protein